MIKRAEENGEIEGIKVCRGASVLSHLIFADASLILIHADGSNARKLKQLLDDYCENSGQKISVEKIKDLFFGEYPSRYQS